MNDTKQGSLRIYLKYAKNGEAAASDAKKLQDMAKGQGSLFKREEDLVAMGMTL